MQWFYASVHKNFLWRRGSDWRLRNPHSCYSLAKNKIVYDQLFYYIDRVREVQYKNLNLGWRDRYLIYYLGQDVKIHITLEEEEKKHTHTLLLLIVRDVNSPHRQYWKCYLEITQVLTLLSGNMRAETIIHITNKDAEKNWNANNSFVANIWMCRGPTTTTNRMNIIIRWIDKFWIDEEIANFFLQFFFSECLCTCGWKKKPSTKHAIF